MIQKGFQYSPATLSSLLYNPFDLPPCLCVGLNGENAEDAFQVKDKADKVKKMFLILLEIMSQKKPLEMTV